MTIRLMLGACALVSVVAACGHGGSAGDTGAATEAPILGASVRDGGRTLVLKAGGDPCSTVSRHDVDQRDDEVVVAVYLRGPESDAPGCTAMTGTTYDVTITLDAPLGARVVRTTSGSTVVLRSASPGAAE